MTHHHDPREVLPPRWYDSDSTRPPAASGPAPASSPGLASSANPAVPRAPGPRETPDDPAIDPGGAAGEGATEASRSRTPLGPDATAREIGRAVRAAFLGSDLIQSGPPLWPFGQRARARRERNRAATVQARRRRAQFQQAFEAPPAPAPRPPTPQRRADRPTHRIVIASLAGFAAAVVTATVWLGGGPDSHPSTRPAPLPGATTTAPAAATSGAPPISASTTGTAAVPAQPPIPSGGVAPITPRPRTTTVNPTSVVVVDPPTGDPTPAELATPEGAVRAWLARLCPFDYRDPFGTAERRARPAMTDTGWIVLDPSRNAGARASWDTTVAARESGRCAAPTALVSPEAPRSPSAAIVIGAVTRLITPAGGQPYGEQLSEVRIVRHGADGLWRVDLPTEGG